jgi:Mg2+-importing ATPase
VATISTLALTLIFPFTPLGVIFGFNPLPLSFLLLVGIIVSGYIISAEMAKTVFYRKVR